MINMNNVNTKHTELPERSGLIILRNVYGKEKAPCWIQPLKQANGIPWPFVKRTRLIDGSVETEMILSESEMGDPESVFFLKEDEMIEIKDGTEFDLGNPMQYNQWVSIMTSPLIATERDATDDKGELLIDGGNARYGSAEFYIERPGKDSEKRVSRMKLITTAYNYIESDTVRGRLTKVKLLGKSMHNAPQSDVQDYLYQRAELEPRVIIELYTGTDQHQRLLLIDAKDKGVITNKNGVWVYGDVKLGTTDETVLMWFQNPVNTSIFEDLRDQTYPELVAAIKRTAKESEIEKQVIVAKPTKTSKPTKTTNKR